MYVTLDIFHNVLKLPFCDFSDPVSMVLLGESFAKNEDVVLLIFSSPTKLLFNSQPSGSTDVNCKRIYIYL